ncbi:MAG: hypothetical protein WCQ23_07510 [Candidatus Methanomethylophilaceae archaeon]
MNPLKILAVVAIVASISFSGYVYWIYEGTAQSPDIAIESSDSEAADVGLRITIGSFVVGSEVDNVDPSKAQVYFKIMIKGDECRIPETGTMEYDLTAQIDGKPMTKTANESSVIPVVSGRTYNVSVFMKDFDNDTVSDTIDLVPNDNLVSGISLQFTAGQVWNEGNYMTIGGNNDPWGSCSIYFETVAL